ncbi:MAG: hypothetical protein AAB289_01995 [Chloroflexota bacterium]
MKTQLLLLALGLGLMSGCATFGGKTGSQRVVERIPSNEPTWKGKSAWEKKDALCYAGAVAGRSDMALALREARAEGEKKVAEQIRQKIRTEFGSAVEGQNLDNQLGTYVRDLIVKVSENVAVSGVKQSETFVEKVEETTGFGVRYLYNAYALLELAKADYLQARKDALDGAVSEARRANNARAEESLKKAFEKLESGQSAAGSATR